MSDKHQISDRDQIIIERLKAGDSLRDVGDRIGLSRERVWSIFHQHEPDYKLGGKPRPKVIERDAKRLRDAREAIVVDGVRRGVDVAARLGCSPATASRVLRQLKEEDPEVAAILFREEISVGQRLGEWEVLSETKYYKRWDGSFSTSIQDDNVSSYAIHLKCRCSCGAEPFSYVAKRYLLGGQSKGCNRCFARRSPNHKGYKGAKEPNYQEENETL